MERLAVSPMMEKLFGALRALVEVEGVARADLSPTVPVELLEAAMDGPPLRGLDAIGVVAEARRRVGLLFAGVLEGSHRQTQRRLHCLVKVQRKKRFMGELDRLPRDPVRQGHGAQLRGQEGEGSWHAESWGEASARYLSATGPVSGAFLDGLAAGDTRMDRGIFRRTLLLRLGLHEVVGEGRCPFSGPCRFTGCLHAGHSILCLNGQQVPVHRKLVRRLEREFHLVGVKAITPLHPTGGYEYESGAPFLLCNTAEERGQRIEIVLEPGALSKVAPPAGTVESDTTYHTWLDPRKVSRKRVETDFGKSVCIDVTVTGVATRSNMMVRGGVSSSTVVGVSAARAENSKLHYIPLLGVGYLLRTFAAESGGLFGKQAMHIMEKIAEHAVGAGVDDPEGVPERQSVYLRRMWQRMSVALHTAVAEKAEDWLRRVGGLLARGEVGVG
jgi:hypothetical protein